MQQTDGHRDIVMHGWDELSRSVYCFAYLWGIQAVLLSE